MNINLLSSAINTDNFFLKEVVGNDYIEILEQVKILAIEYVNQFAQSADFAEKMSIAFGDNINFSSLQEKWEEGEIIFPTIEVRSLSELGNAWGAFAQSTGKIYLAEELLLYQSSEKILEVLLEEYGHYIDSQINIIDSQGDEGAIFSKLALGENILEKELEFLQNKNDQVTIILDGTTVEIEQQGRESNPYNFQIIAKGSDIEKGVSINDRGRVAFIQDGDLFVTDHFNSPVEYQSNGTLQPGVQINNQDQVIAVTKFLLGNTSLFLWDASNSAITDVYSLIAKSGIPRNYGDPTEYFELLLSYPSVNNLAHAQNQYPSLSEKTVFSSLLKNDFGSLGSVLSTPVFVDNAGTAIYNTIPIDNPIYPVIADNGEIVVRLGNRDRTNDNGPMSPIVVYKPDLKSNSRVSIAGVFNGFQALGQKPGISDDGQIVVFYGDLAAADLVDETPPMNEKEQLDLLNTTQGNLWYKNGGKLRLDELEPGPGIFASIAVKDAFWDKNNNRIFDTGDEDITRVLVRIADLYDGFNYFENNGAVRVNSTYRGEDFVDTNGNGIWDFDESYTDSNKNGVYDVSKQAVKIIYLADNRNNDKGIYESSLHFVPQNVGRFDPDRPSGFLVSEPSYIIGKDTVLPQWGGVTTPTLGNSIKDVDIHDSINQRGDIVFWAENYLEETGVIRASQQSVKFDQAVYKVKENDTKVTVKLTREGDLQEPLSLFVNFVDIFGINEGGEIIIDLLVNISSIFLSQLGSIPLAIANKAISSASAEMEDFVDGFSAIPVFFAANQSTAEVEIIIKDDSEYEGDQAVVLSLSHNNFTTNPLLVNNLGTDALLVIEDDESIIDGLKDVIPSEESLVYTLLGMVLFTLNVTKDALRTEEGLPKIEPSLNWKDTLKQLIQLDVKKETFGMLKSTLAESIIVPFYGSILQHGIIFALEDYYKYQKKLESLSPTFLSPQSEASGVSSEFQSSSESLVESNNLTPVSVNDLGYMIGLSSSDTDSSGILIKPDGQMVYLQDNNNQTIIPVDINNSQQVVGYSKTINDLPYAVMWQDNVVTNLVTQLGEVASQATAINESGQIIINSQNELGALDAFLWLNGELIRLNQNNQNSYAVDINNLGQVIGYLETSNGGFGLEGFVWQNGSMTKLGSLGGSLTIPTAINEQGKIIGIATTAEGEFQSFIWEDGEIQPLVSFDSNGSIPIDINDSGQVVGIYDQVSTVNSGEIESRAFLWNGGNITELGTLGGETTLPLSINNLGQIIGLSDLDDSVSAPFLWQQGSFLNIDEVLSIADDSKLLGIFDINNSGKIIATILDSQNQVHSSILSVDNGTGNINRQPEAIVDQATTNQNTAVDINVLANDRDLDGDPLTISLGNLPANGSAIINNNNTPNNPSDDFITYTPNYNFTGTDSFTYNISDGKGGTANATVTITVESNSGIRNLTNNQNGYGSYYPQISGNNIIWKTVNPQTSQDDLVFFDGNSSRVIASNIYLGTYALFGDRVVWSQYTDEDSDLEIYFYDGNDTVRLTDNDIEDYDPIVSDQGVAWFQRVSGSGDYSEVYYFDGNNTQKLTNNIADYSFASDGQILGNKVVWTSRIFNMDYPIIPGGMRPPADDYDIFYFDGNSLINLSETYGTDSLNNTPDSVIWRDGSPRFSENGKVYWSSSGYDLSSFTSGGNSTYVFDGNSVNSLPIDFGLTDVSGDKLVGISSEGLAYIYQNGITKRISESGYYQPRDYQVNIYGDNVLLYSAPQGHGTKAEIFVYKNGKLTQVSNSASEMVSDPQISGDNVTWWGYQDSNYNADIFLVTAPDSDNSDNILNDPLFRFQNQDRPGTYLFVGEQERISVLREYSPPFVEEGFAFNISYEEQDDLMRFNRFQNKNVPGTYLFAGEEESVSIRQNYSDSFTEEGIAFYAFQAEANKGVDYYRFQNTEQPGTYIFVGENEKTSILTNYPQFQLEGVAFEVNA